MAAGGQDGHDGDEPALLSLQDAAAELGVHYMTLYRKVRAGEMPAELAGGRYRIRASDLRAWQDARSARGGATSTAPGRRDWDRHAATFLQALTEGTGETARAMVERLVANGADPVEVCERVLTPALYAIGERWASGTYSVAEEHRATAIVEATVASVAPAFSAPGPRRGVAVVATVAGTRHTVGAAMVAGALRADRFVVHYLGADVPTADLVRLAQKVDADVVAVSCPAGVDPTAFRTTVTAVVEAGVPVVVGGSGVDGSWAEGVPGVEFGRNLRDAQRLARAAADGR